MNRFFDIPSDLQHSWAGLIGLHLREALLPVLGGLLLALPLAQLCVRLRWLYPPVLWVTTVLYAIPSLAFFVVLIDYTGQTETTVMIPLTVYTLVVLVPAIVDASARSRRRPSPPPPPWASDPYAGTSRSSCRSPCPPSSRACGWRPCPASAWSASAP